MDVTRRLLLGGVGAVLAAPAIVRATSIMPVKMAWEDKLFIKAYEHIDPRSWGVPRSGWFLDNGMPIDGCPKMIWTWDQFVRELKRPDPHPNLVGPKFLKWPYNKSLAFDVAPGAGQPNWVGWYDKPFHYDSRRRITVSGDV